LPLALSFADVTGIRSAFDDVLLFKRRYRRN
jgi:hypothetical protein